MKTYVIIGATGNTGKPIAAGLLAKGHRVRALTRDAAKARDLADQGAEVVVGRSDDPAVLTKAFQGADAVYAMLPPEVGSADLRASQASHTRAIEGALRAVQVRHAVTLSSVGAHLAEGSGVVLGLHRMEEALSAVPGLNVLHLRPTYFMENTLSMAGMARHMGVLGSPVKADLPMTMIATRDIAEVALRRLLALDFAGSNVLHLLGQRDLTYAEVAKVYGAAIGRDLPYVEFSYEDARKAMLAMGLGGSFVDLLLEFVRALNSGRVGEQAVRTPETTTPTSIEEFATVFKAAYDAA